MSTPCNVSLNDFDCEYPAAMEDGGEPIRTRCYRCGLPACRSCSTVRVARAVGGRRRIRICRDCEQYEPRSTP